VAGEYQLTINGEQHLFAAQPTLREVLRQLNLEPDKVAIELNRAIVKKEFWDSTTVAPGSELEIVQFVGGG